MTVTVKELSAILAMLDPDATVYFSMVCDQHPNVPGSQRRLQSECSRVIDDPLAEAVFIHGSPTEGG